MRRAEVVLVDWVHSDLTVGKRRPAVVVQANFLNSLIANTVLIRVTKTVRSSATEVVIDPSAPSSLDLGAAELVRVRVFLKSHDFSYPKTKR